MSELDTWMKAIIENRDDPQPRLEFADWLEEREDSVQCERCGGTGRAYSRWRQAEMDKDDYGESWSACDSCKASGWISNGFAARAEFIRCQIELENTPALIEVEKEMSQREYQANYHLLKPQARFDLIDPRERRGVTRWLEPNPDLLDLRIREKDLLELHWHPWSGISRATCCANFHNSGALGVFFRRGFVESVTISPEDWLACHEKLFWHPSQSGPCPTCKGGVPGNVPLTYCCPKCGNHVCRRHRQTSEYRAICQECIPGKPQPRSFQPSAQPIGDVHLTSPPTMSAWGGAGLWRNEDGSYLDARWPGLRFHWESSVNPLPASTVAAEPW